MQVSLQEPDPCCYFAVRSTQEREAEEDCSRMGHATWPTLRRFTQFTKFSSFWHSVLNNISAYLSIISAILSLQERSEWVLGLSHTILLIIDSLLPMAELSCDPLPGIPKTFRRLLAGYLIHRRSARGHSRCDSGEVDSIDSIDSIDLDEDDEGIKRCCGALFWQKMDRWKDTFSMTIHGLMFPTGIVIPLCPSLSTIFSAANISKPLICKVNYWIFGTLY